MSISVNITLEIPSDLQRIIDGLSSQGQIVYVYIGNFTEAHMDKIIEEIELSISNIPKKLKKRVFKISIELIQNIYKHSTPVPENLIKGANNFGFYILTKFSNFAYEITVGNLVTKKQKDNIEEYLKTIKTLNSEQLKEFYYQILDSKTFTAKGGGGLGFLEIAKKSNSNFDFKFIKYNLGLYLFIYKVNLSIENQ